MKKDEEKPNKFRWEMQEATKKNKKKKAIGEILMGIREKLMDKEFGIKTGRGGIVVGKVRKGEEK